MLYYPFYIYNMVVWSNHVLLIPIILYSVYLWIIKLVIVIDYKFSCTHTCVRDSLKSINLRGICVGKSNCNQKIFIYINIVIILFYIKYYLLVFRIWNQSRLKLYICLIYLYVCILKRPYYHILSSIDSYQIYNYII